MEPCIPGKEKKDRGVDGERQKIKEKKSRQREKQGQIDRERERERTFLSPPPPPPSTMNVTLLCRHTDKMADGFWGPRSPPRGNEIEASNEDAGPFLDKSKFEKNLLVPGDNQQCCNLVVHSNFNGSGSQGLPWKTLYCPGTGSSSSSINGVSSPGDPAAAGTFQQHRESPNGGGGKEKCKIKRRRRERDEWATSHEGPCSGNSSENVARKIWFS
ncbi:hypothetical protein RUM43_000144 [Polyplax serrata]|uniref:Uncharacterized protein n=1 Tax=Polyplax serrata TaxID=468196 RepID=A0AAN8SGB6_POLSC